MSEGKASMADSVVLRDVTETDLPSFFAFQLDAESNRMAAFAARDRDSFMAHWGKVLGNPANINQTILYDGEIAGNIASFEQDGQREVSYWIGREFWGRGVATRALAAFVNKVTTRPLYGYAATHNLASRRVLEKCGFALVGRHEAIMTLDGADVPGFVFKLDAGSGA
jgi:RimJ/RimL family protein N-acetyltransferase